MRLDNTIETALAATRRRIASPAWVDDFFRLPAPVGRELDGLANDIAPEERHAALAALRAIQPHQKLAVLGMARDEAPYLAEWVAHYRAIGADRIFVYTNDNRDGTEILLRWLSENGPVVPIFNTIGPGVNVQIKNYEHALLLLPELRLYEWVAVVDVDEFLIPAARFNHHLPTMLAAAPADTDAIVFPWRWRLWDRSFERQPGLLAERYPHARSHILVKSVVRPRSVTSLRDIHAPQLEPGGIIRDTEFAPVSHGQIWGKPPKTSAGGWIDHYWGKSFEEFMVKKHRGDSLALTDGKFHRDYTTFFSWTDPIGPGSFSPVPEAMLTALKRELARFEAKPGYAELRAQLENRYAASAGEIRENAELQRVYADYMQRHAFL